MSDRPLKVGDHNMQDGRLSLYGMTPEEAIRKALSTPPATTADALKKPSQPSVDRD